MTSTLSSHSNRALDTNMGESPPLAPTQMPSRSHRVVVVVVSAFVVVLSYVVTRYQLHHRCLKLSMDNVRIQGTIDTTVLFVQILQNNEF